MITVRDLIAKLSELPLDAAVVTAGFDESDFDDISRVETIRIKRGAGRGGHSGKHLEGGDTDETAVFIDR